MADRTFIAQVTERTERRRKFIAACVELPPWLQHALRHLMLADAETQRKAMQAVGEILADALVEKCKQLEVLGWDPVGTKRDLVEIAEQEMLPPLPESMSEESVHA